VYLRCFSNRLFGVGSLLGTAGGLGLGDGHGGPFGAGSFGGLLSHPGPATAGALDGRGLHAHFLLALAQVDPDLDADLPVGGVSLGEAVIDVGPKSVEGYRTFGGPFAA